MIWTVAGLDAASLSNHLDMEPLVTYDVLPAYEYKDRLTDLNYDIISC